MVEASKFTVKELKGKLDAGEIMNGDIIEIVAEQAADPGAADAGQEKKPGE